MKKSLRFISLLIAVVFMISGAVMVICHADEGDGQTGQRGAENRRVEEQRSEGREGGPEDRQGDGPESRHGEDYLQGDGQQQG